MSNNEALDESVIAQALLFAYEIGFTDAVNGRSNAAHGAKQEKIFRSVRGTFPELELPEPDNVRPEDLENADQRIAELEAMLFEMCADMEAGERRMSMQARIWFDNQK